MKSFLSPHFTTKNSACFIAILFLCRSYWLTAQTSAPSGIFADTIYHCVKLTSDVVYGSNYNPFYNQVDTLKLDTYEPNATIDYLRPLIIYAHGSFKGGDKTGDKALAFGNYFAKCGYLYASIDYRLYIDDSTDTIDNFQGVYMATQDAKSAVRFFRKHAGDYCVDTSMIFMIGTSAGGAVCLTSAYWDQEEADQIFNTTEWGPLENSSGNEGYSSRLTAIVSCWGGIPDTSWLRNEKTPNQLFHGTDDPSVPYMWGLSGNGVHLFGGYTIHEASIADHIESYLHPFVGAGHGVRSDVPQFDTLLQISTDFLYNHLKNDEGTTHCNYSSDNPSMCGEDVILISTLNEDQLLILNTASGPFAGTLRIYSLSGSIMLNSEITIASGSSTQVDCSSFASGCYLVEIQSESLRKVSKVFLKE